MESKYITITNKAFLLTVISIIIYGGAHFFVNITEHILLSLALAVTMLLLAILDHFWTASNEPDNQFLYFFVFVMGWVVAISGLVMTGFYVYYLYTKQLDYLGMFRSPMLSIFIGLMMSGLALHKLKQVES